MISWSLLKLGADFHGSDYDHDLDHAALTSQLARIFGVMRDEGWYTYDDIKAKTEIRLTTSISAHFRSLRKQEFGGFLVEKRSQGERKHRWWEYRLQPPPPKPAKVELPHVDFYGALTVIRIDREGILVLDKTTQVVREYFELNRHTRKAIRQVIPR